MTRLHCGLDFGTTNSSVAVAGGGGVRVLSLDPLNDNPLSLPSLLYISSTGEQIVGRRAASAFIERNVDREVVLRQVDLGISIEAYVGGEPDKSESYRPRDEMENIREAVRAHATVEVNSPGRLFQSVKSVLRSRGFKGTDVFGRHYQIEELVALILAPMKAALELEAGEEVDTVVLGRPVRFARDDEGNALAEERLKRGASLAGFKNIATFFEPVAACVEYAVNADSCQRLMVVDIGGGTCDVCIMEFGGGSGAAQRLAESRILSVAGVPVAGDAVDKEIMRAKLFPALGSRCRYGPSQLPMPLYVYNGILDWQNLYKLNTEEVVNWLIAVETSSTDPAGIRALRTLIQRNYGYPMLRTAEQAKKRLSTDMEAVIEVHYNKDLDVRVTLNRDEFLDILEYPLRDMRRSIMEAERLAGVTPKDMDLVLTTGGTSLIPAVRNMLISRFGAEKILHRDTFTSVAQGLAIVAQYL